MIKHKIHNLQQTQLTKKRINHSKYYDRLNDWIKQREVEKIGTQIYSCSTNGVYVYYARRDQSSNNLNIKNKFRRRKLKLSPAEKTPVKEY